MKTDVNMKALHHAMPSALEGIIIEEPVVLFELVLTADVFFIFDPRVNCEEVLLLGAEKTGL